MLWRGLIIAGVGGALLWVLAPLFWFGLNSAMGWQTDLQPSVETYLGIRIWAAPAVLFSYVCFGWLVGQQRTGMVLLLQAFINLTNIAVSAWLVLVLDMGVAGVALGSVIASYAGVALGGLILLRLGIILYGFKLTLQQLTRIGVAGVTADIFTVCSTMLLGHQLGVRVLRLPPNLTTLISSGASICGCSAVVASFSRAAADFSALAADFSAMVANFSAANFSDANFSVSFCKRSSCCC